MMANLRAVGTVALSSLILGACATKGFVRDRVATERTDRIAADSSIMTDVSSVRSDVATLRNDVTSLRNDLQALRTEFGAKITAMEEGMRFAFPVTFAFDDATVREADMAALDRFASVVAKYYPGSTITVEGFADPAGSRAYNMDLSQRRAESVMSYLGEKGMTNTNLRAVGYGSARQVNPGAERDDPGAEANRRVVFVVESKGGANAVAMQ
ncbi:MAG TPA: OmpA family protein [Gemmatimonadaceae bacterium]|nr:OmpA family protein [Gemmatimonadaceae bacterium]